MPKGKDLEEHTDALIQWSDISGHFSSQHARGHEGGASVVFITITPELERGQAWKVSNEWELCFKWKNTGMFKQRQRRALMWLWCPDALCTGRQVCVPGVPTRPPASPPRLFVPVRMSWGLLASRHPAAWSTFLSGTSYLCPPAKKEEENKTQRMNDGVGSRSTRWKEGWCFRQLGSPTLGGDCCQVFSWWKKRNISQQSLPELEYSPLKQLS